jgi:alginate O-acetyltransferase complex protein AlgI
MLFTALSDYAHGILIERYRGEKAAGVLLASSVLINLSLLFYAGYGAIGVFFYTLQTMSYTIDVYRGEVKARRNLLDYAVYVTMFPQLMAGPIVKYRQVEADLHFRKTDIYQISYGAKRFVFGLAKKVLLAGSLEALWAEVSACDFGNLSVLTAWLGIFAYALRIYFDFSGYSDMAIGLGAVLGFRFPENFNYPYISVSVS